MEVVMMDTAVLEEKMNKLTVVDDNNIVVTKLKEAAAHDNKDIDDDDVVVVISSETEKIGENLNENSEPAEPQSSRKKYKKRNEKINNKIQVSNTKKPFFFYLNLAKWQLKKHKYVELSALGMAIPTAILISEILKRNGQAIEKKVLTFLVNSKEEENGHLIQKSKIMITLEKADNHKKTAAAASEASKDAADTET